MTLLVFLLLGVLWGAVFIPAIVRARLDNSPIATVGMFRRGMHALSASGRAFSGGRWIVVPPTAEQVVEEHKQAMARHRQQLSWLMLAAATTLLLGLLPGLGVLVKVHVALDLAVVGYVVFLIRTRQRRLDAIREAAARRRAAAEGPRRIIDLRDDAPVARTLHVFGDEEEDDSRYLKAGQF